MVEESRPAREAFLAAAEEFLKVEALFPGRRDGLERGARGDVGGRGGGRGRGPGSEVSFMSLLTEGAMQRCPWPGAWDRWVEECLRDAQVSEGEGSDCRLLVVWYGCVRVTCTQVLEAPLERMGVALGVPHTFCFVMCALGRCG